MRNLPLAHKYWLLLLLVVASTGCVRRRLTVRTQPAGAMVYVDKQPIGMSPISTSVTYYGTREIEVVGDGYRTEKVLRTFKPPWYQWPGLDFISETLWPWEIRDERVVDMTLVPYQAPTSEELQARGDGLRVQASQGVGVPLPPTQVQPPASVPIAPGPVLPPASPPPSGPLWQPGQILGEIVLPGGELPRRIPEVGGSYRPVTE